MKIELLKTMTEVGPFAGEVVDYEKAKAVAYVNAGYAKWLPEEEEAVVAVEAAPEIKDEPVAEEEEFLSASMVLDPKAKK